MTPQEEILKYLETPENRRDYLEGINLLEKYGREKSVISLLKRKIYPKKLYYKLSELSKQKRIVERSVEPSKMIQARKTVMPLAKNQKKEKKEPQKFVSKDAENLPEPLKKLHAEIVEKHKKTRSLHERMKLAKSEASIAKFNKEIASLHKEIKEGYAILDNYKETGEMPENLQKQKAGIDAKSIAAARKYISISLPKLEALKDEAKIAKLKESIKERYLLLLEANNEFTEDTLTKLAKNGII
jgi:hypothetical protein